MPLQLIEFDDPKDTADLRDASDTSLTPFAVNVSSPDRTLDVSTKTGEDGDSVVVRVKAPPLSAAGSVTFQVRGTGEVLMSGQQVHVVLCSWGL